ncbi:MAG TPA: XRE family transcriptional regulator [Candidatus Limnocylindria bacterium]|nr:XRE family transcriptional regulator [Candidatus Limnocylindria bacterium]
MKPGTPGFVGGRLREARLARGQSRTRLGLAVGLSPQAIGGYERGALSPKPANMHALAVALGFPVAFFLLPSRRSDGGPSFVCSTVRMSQPERQAAELQLDWLGHISQSLERFVELPAARFLPRRDGGAGGLSLAEIEASAGALREAWLLGDAPVHNVVAVAEAHGICVARVEAAHSRSLSRARAGTRPLLYIAGSRASGLPLRVDAAHQLGHLILHSRIDRSKLADPVLKRRLESEARQFGAAFLLPAESFGAGLGTITIDALRAQKPKWKVPISTMLTRAAALELVGAADFRRLWRLLVRRGWRRLEPEDGVAESERPRLLAHAFELVAESGLALPQQVLDELGYPAEDVERLAGLPAGYFAAEAPNVRLLPRFRTDTVRAGGGGKVVPFRQRH